MRLDPGQGLPASVTVTLLNSLTGYQATQKPGSLGVSPGRLCSTSWSPWGRPIRPPSSIWTRPSSRRSSTLAFSRPFYAGGLINRRTVLRSAYAQFVYLLGGADHDQMERMREYLSAMCTGWDVADGPRDRRRHPAPHRRPDDLRRGGELIEQHHAAGRDVVIVSSSGAEVVEPIGEMLGADKVIATRMVVADGKYTGEIEHYAYGPHKATAITRAGRGRGL